MRARHASTSALELKRPAPSMVISSRSMGGVAAEAATAASAADLTRSRRFIGKPKFIVVRVVWWCRRFRLHICFETSPRIHVACPHSRGLGSAQGNTGRQTREQVSGAPLLRNTRLPVEAIVGNYDAFLEEGLSPDSAIAETLDCYPEAGIDTIRAILNYRAAHQFQAQP
jgi:uncharacterized protein (DUF433 family)